MKKTLAQLAEDLRGYAIGSQEQAYMYQAQKAPESWSWEHMAITTEGESIRARVCDAFSKGCIDCHHRWSGGRGYVEVIVEGSFGKTKAVTECPRCRELRKTVQGISEAGLPAKFQGRSLDWEQVVIDGSSGDEAKSALYEWMDDVVKFLKGKTFSKPPSVSLLGPTGRGKSHVAFYLLRRAITSGVRVKWVEWSHMLDQIMSKERPKPQVIAENLVEPGLIVLDDLGVGTFSGWARDIACSILERIPRDSVCIFTSNGIPHNDGPNGLDAMIGARAASRLSGVCGRGSAFFEFAGKDWRKGEAT